MSLFWNQWFQVGNVRFILRNSDSESLGDLPQNTQLARGGARNQILPNLKAPFFLYHSVYKVKIQKINRKFRSVDFYMISKPLEYKFNCSQHWEVLSFEPQPPSSSPETGCPMAPVVSHFGILFIDYYPCFSFQ